MILISLHLAWGAREITASDPSLSSLTASMPRRPQKSPNESTKTREVTCAGLAEDPKTREGPGAAGSDLPRDEEVEQGLLRVQSVLRLVEDDGLRPVDHAC